MSRDLTKEEREHLKHTMPFYERGGEREPREDIYAQAHVVNVLPSGSVDNIPPHYKMCVTNFKNALIHKIDSYLPRFKDTQHRWCKRGGTIIPLIRKGLFKAFWNDGKGRPFGPKEDGLDMNICLQH